MGKNNHYLFFSLLIPYLSLALIFWQMAYPYFCGQEIFLQAQLSDPRDLLRGQYLELSYEFTFFDLSQRKISLKRKEYLPQHELYLLLEKGLNNFYEAILLQDEKPKTGLFLRVMPRYGFSLPDDLKNTPIAVELQAGIENYFISEKEMVKFKDRDKFTAKIIVAPSGVARIISLE